jgi:hypothetical protein
MTDIAEATWARVDDGFYVGSRDGVFLGCIDVLPDGRFAALDARTQPIGTRESLPEAMHAVISASQEESR